MRWKPRECGVTEVQWPVEGQERMHTVFSNMLIIGYLGERHFGGLEGAVDCCNVRTRIDSLEF